MQGDIHALDQFIERIFQKKELPGLSVMALGPNGERFARGYGSADAAGERKCDEHTVFGIASMSKSQTALACAILACEGKLSFDDPVSYYFPEFRLPGTPRDSVTLRHLAMHTSGIPPIEALEWSIAMHAKEREDDWILKLRQNAPNAMSTIDQIIEYIATCGYPLLGAPGEQMSYCNEGYAILSYVVDMAAGKPLETFLKDRIFAPLGMRRTLLDVDGNEAKAMAGGNITSLFERIGEKLTCDEEWSVLPPYRGCGLVKSTAHDMAVYYRCLANYGRHEGVQVFPREAVEMMVGIGFPARKEASYCLGLSKREQARRVICEHSGGLHGTSCHGGLLLGEGWGFAALSNIGEEDVSTAVWPMYNWAMGLPLETSHRWFHDTGRPFSNPEMVEGTYRTHEGLPMDVTVYQQNGALFALKEEKRMPLSYCGGMLFAAFDEGGEPLLRIEALIREGHAWGVRCGSRVYQRVDAGARM